ncbi:MAG: TRAP transporter permease [Thermodesulfobacteriota bacterium]
MAEESAKEGKKRELRGIIFVIGSGMAIALSLFQLYTAGLGALTAMFQRGIHLMLILAVVFLYYPPAQNASRNKVDKYFILDFLLFSLSFIVILYILFFFEEIIVRQGEWTTLDIILGIIIIILTVEATRRIIGLVMAILCLLFIAYGYLGPYIPGVLAHKGYNTYRIIGQLYLTTEGIFGLPLGVAATFVFIFVLFGSFLEGTGGGTFFTRLAYALTGRMVGGPAKTAVIASGFMGSVSGSAVANVVTTGSFTIPMMKKIGYKPYIAGAIEAAASTGGQIMPPIMGAGAFLMAEFTNTPYINIVKIAIIPAIMYYFTCYCFVHFQAKKLNIKPLDAQELPKLFEVIKGGFQFLIPIFVLIYFLIANYSPMMVGFVGVLSVLGVAMLSKDTRIGLDQLLKLLENGTHNAIMVSVACAAAGIIVGMVTLTGLGLKFSSLVLSFSGGVKLIAIGLIGIAALFLGMGLPVTAAYIVLVILAGPALVEMGMWLLGAHMIVFWFSQTSNVTPPVALAAFAGAGLAGAGPMRTGFASCQAALGLYLIPVLMAYRPLLLNGPEFEIISAIICGSLGLLALSSVIVRYFIKDNNIIDDILLGIASFGLFLPHWGANVGGLAFLFFVWLSQKRRKEIIVQ